MQHSARHLLVLFAVSWAAIFWPTTTADAQSPTSQDFQVNEATLDDQDISQVSSASDGSFVILWHDDSQEYLLIRRLGSDGAALGGELQVNASTASFGGGGVLSHAPDDSFVVAWGIAYGGSYGTGYTGVPLLRRFDSSGVAVGAEIEARDPQDGFVEPSAIDHATDGSFVVVWNRFQYPYYDAVAYGRRFDSGGTPLGATFPVSASENARTSSVSLADDSSFVVVWGGENESGDDGAWGRRFASDGTGLGAELQMGDDTSASSPAVDHTDDDSFVVVWDVAESFPIQGEVRGQRFSSSGAEVGAELLVNTYTTFQQLDPQVAVDGGDRFTVVWTSTNQDGGMSETGVFGQRFDADGSALGGEFLVNTYTTQSQKNARISALAGDSFVVGWGDESRDGSQNGVFGRTFCAYTTSDDADFDGVADNCDVCPGFDDNADEDGDLIPDGCDPCFGIGPDDSDGDGFCDEIVFLDGFESGDTSAWTAAIN